MRRGEQLRPCLRGDARHSPPHLPFLTSAGPVGMQRRRLRARLRGGALEQPRHVAQALAGVARGLARGRQQLRVCLPAAAFSATAPHASAWWSVVSAPHVQEGEHTLHIGERSLVFSPSQQEATANSRRNAKVQAMRFISDGALPRRSRARARTPPCASRRSSQRRRKPSARPWSSSLVYETPMESSTSPLPGSAASARFHAAIACAPGALKPGRARRLPAAQQQGRGSRRGAC